MACYAGGQYWKYYRSVPSLRQVLAFSLKIQHPSISSQLLPLDYMGSYQDSSTSDVHQGDMYHLTIDDKPFPQS